MESNTMLSGALRPIVGPLNQLFQNLSREDGQKWYNMFLKFLRKEPCWSQQVNKYLREIVADPEDPDLSLTIPTGRGFSRIRVFELVYPATFMQIFRGLNSQLDDLSLTEEEVECFIDMNSGESLLPQKNGRGGTFFLQKKGNDLSIVMAKGISFDFNKRAKYTLGEKTKWDYFIGHRFVVRADGVKL